MSDDKHKFLSGVIKLLKAVPSNQPKPLESALVASEADLSFASFVRNVYRAVPGMISLQEADDAVVREARKLAGWPS